MKSSGFSLMEILVSLAILSIGVGGFLGLDHISLQTSNATQDLQDERTLTNNLYEALYASQITHTPCDNCADYQQAFNARFLHATLNINPLGTYATQIKICDAQQSCHEILVQA